MLYNKKLFSLAKLLLLLTRGNSTGETDIKNYIIMIYVLLRSSQFHSNYETQCASFNSEAGAKAEICIAV